MQKIRILLAEDDADDRDLFSLMFKPREDIHILPIQQDGEELIQYLDQLIARNELPDLIVLDFNMPRMNGKQVLQQLKSCEKSTAIPVIIYSTYADDAFAEECMRLGAALVQLKPYSLQEYDLMINKFLRTIARIS